MRKFYFSPHFDDAVGSCGCDIYSSYKNDINTTIVTLFSGERPKCISNFAKSLLCEWNLENGVTERVLENENACKILHSSVINLPFIEAIYRIYNGEIVYSSKYDLFNKYDPSDYDLKYRMLSEIEKLITKDDMLYFPISRGNHVDHIIANEVGRILEDKGYTVIYYNDFSYEGKTNIEYAYSKIVNQYNEECLNKKKLAMKAYSSQLAMLFENTTLDEYYIKENVNNNIVFEVFFVNK